MLVPLRFLQMDDLEALALEHLRSQLHWSISVLVGCIQKMYSTQNDYARQLVDDWILWLFSTRRRLCLQSKHSRIIDPSLIPFRSPYPA